MKRDIKVRVLFALLFLLLLLFAGWVMFGYQALAIALYAVFQDHTVSMALVMFAAGAALILMTMMKVMYSIKSLFNIN